MMKPLERAQDLAKNCKEGSYLCELAKALCVVRCIPVDAWRYIVAEESLRRHLTYAVEAETLSSFVAQPED